MGNVAAAARVAGKERKKLMAASPRLFVEAEWASSASRPAARRLAPKANNRDARADGNFEKRTAVRPRPAARPSFISSSLHGRAWRLGVACYWPLAKSVPGHARRLSRSPIWNETGAFSTPVAGKGVLARAVAH